MQLNGELSKVSLPNLIQLVKNGELTGKITLMQGARAANIFVEQGDIVHVDIEGYTGREALFELFLWVTGTFSFSEMDLTNRPRTFNPTQPEDSIDRLLREGINYLEQKKYLEQLRITGDTILAITDRLKELENQSIGNHRLAAALNMIQPVVNKLDGRSKLSEALKDLVMSRRAYAQILAIILAEGIAVVVEKPLVSSEESINLPSWVIARLKQDHSDLTQSIINMVIWVDRVKCWMYQADVDLMRVLDRLRPLENSTLEGEKHSALAPPVVENPSLFGTAPVYGAAPPSGTAANAIANRAAAPRVAPESPAAQPTESERKGSAASIAPAAKSDTGARSQRPFDSQSTNKDEAAKSIEF
jgi:hypothetical protein